MDYLKELKFALRCYKLNVSKAKMQRIAVDQLCVKKINCVTNFLAKIIDKKSICLEKQASNSMGSIDDMLICQSLVLKLDFQYNCLRHCTNSDFTLCSLSCSFVYPFKAAQPVFD